VSIVALATEGSTYETPGVSDFWQPLFGTDGAFAVTRASIVLLLSVALISWALLAGT
jgi:F-type H+-transporting ATPase subunit a